MPEAVASNSRPMPDRQPPLLDDSQILDLLEDTANTFAALGHFVTTEIDATGDKRIASGVGYLFRREVEEMEEIRIHVKARLAADTRRPEVMMRGVSSDAAIWPKLFARVSEIVLNAMRDDGDDLDPDDVAKWADGKRDEWVTLVTTYYGKISAKLDGSRDEMEAGSLLPWLELIVRKDLGLTTTSVAPPQANDSALRATAWPKTLRDQFIMERHKEGHTPSEISQALSLRQSTVLRTIDRLTGRQEGGERKAG